MPNFKAVAFKAVIFDGTERTLVGRGGFLSVGLAGYKTGQGKPMRVLAASVKDEDQRRESHETRLSSISIFCLELFTHTV